MACHQWPVINAQVERVGLCESFASAANSLGSQHVKLCTTFSPHFVPGILVAAPGAGHTGRT
eukprot:1142301-Rhodomonas_salina.4